MVTVEVHCSDNSLDSCRHGLGTDDAAALSRLGDKLVKTVEEASLREKCIACLCGKNATDFS